MNLRRLSQLPEGERKSALDEIVRKAAAPRNGQATSINAKIAAFECQYGISSDEMRRRFAAGEMLDTEDISGWLMLLRVRG